VQKTLEQTRAQLKLVDPELMHLTLRFLGEISQQTAEKVKDIISSIQTQPFNIVFSGVGAFPNLTRINVVWIGIIQGQEQLSIISQNIEPKLRQIGMAADNKGFNPHLTIARVKSGMNREALSKALSEMREIAIGSIHVNSVRLKKSVLTPKGPIYSTIHETQLK